MKYKIDLHIHSNLSDGNLSPKEIIERAKNIGLSIISITDHDTIKAYDTYLFKYAMDNNIILIPGIEISTKTSKAGIHVLGYNIDLNNSQLLKTIILLENARLDYLKKVAIKLREIGYVINEKKLSQIKNVTKAHISLDIINNIKNKDKLLKDFGHIPSKGEFIETIMNEGCIAYVKKNTITPKKASQIIHDAGGIVILAHPVAYKYEDNFSEKQILQLALDIQADGIETYYIYIDKNNNKVDESKLWNRLAKKSNLKPSIGSDFHKIDNIHPNLGLVNENTNIFDEDLNEILKWLKNK